jgi:hypothetical protein
MVHFAGNAVLFNIEDEGIRHALHFHFKHCVKADLPIAAEYTVTKDEKGNFSADLNGEQLFSSLNQRAALWRLTQDALTQLNGIASNVLVFHAAALTYDQDAILLCGKSGSGKSSLAAWLVAEGLGYLTDEVIVRPIDGQVIHGFSQSIVLKAGSSFIWKRWMADAPPDAMMRFPDNSVWIEPTYFNEDVVKSSAVPKILIFPRYEGDADFQVKRISTANAMFGLIQNLVNARNFPDYGFAETSRLARQVEAYEMVYSDIETATAWIKKRLAAN